MFPQISQRNLSGLEGSRLLRPPTRRVVWWALFFPRVCQPPRIQSGGELRTWRQAFLSLNLPPAFHSLRDLGQGA